MAAIKPKNDVIRFTADGDTVAESLGNKRIVAIAIDTAEADATFAVRRKDATGDILWSAKMPPVMDAPIFGGPVSFTTSGGLYFSTTATSSAVHLYCGE